jgi:hypothetical protein
VHLITGGVQKLTGNSHTLIRHRHIYRSRSYVELYSSSSSRGRGPKSQTFPSNAALRITCGRAYREGSMQLFIALRRVNKVEDLMLIFNRSV